MSNIIYPQGGLRTNITIPAGDSIAVYTKDTARVYQIVSYPSYPSQKNQIGIVIDSEVIFGPYPDGAIIQINAGASEVLYNVGTPTNIIEHKGYYVQKDHFVIDSVNFTMTVEMILNGKVVIISSMPISLTLATGFEMEETNMFKINDSLKWFVINVSTFGISINESSNHTFVGSLVIGNGTSSSMGCSTRKVGVGEYVTYRDA